MIEDARQIPNGTALDCDVCIIGGGAAGIAMAREFIGSGCKVILLVGAGRRESAEDRDLYRGFAAPAESHEPLEENRRRIWGGSTTLWGGRCIPFDDIDFEPRDWVPHSGWPVRREELASFFVRATALCEAGEYRFDARDVFPETQPEIVAGLDDATVASWPLERWGPPTDFGRRYEKELRGAANITVLMHAHAKHLQLAPQGGAMRHVVVATNPGHEFTVRARQYVLACGGLENPRLLLAANDVARAGIGNETDNVGRYYQSHLFGVSAFVRLRDPERGFIYEFERDEQGVYCRRRFWITPEAQRERRIGNAIGFFFRPPIAHAVHRNALFSATFLGKFFLGAFKRYGLRGSAARIRAERAVLQEHFDVVMRQAPSLAPQLLRLMQQRFLARRRLPMILAPRSGNQFHLFYQTEHSPNRESRVVLHAERDALGMPRLETRVQFTEFDFATVLEMHRLLQARFTASGVGEFIYREEELRERLIEEARHFNSNAHHIGTTRMSDDPRHGVVDRHGRVHEVENLYVAGCSIFPTSGHANPTLTLVALALRLADHLKAMPATPPC
jgi:choline dehydrogenase-like flavoprotein